MFLQNMPPRHTRTKRGKRRHSRCKKKGGFNAQNFASSIFGPMKDVSNALADKLRRQQFNTRKRLKKVSTTPEEGSIEAPVSTIKESKRIIVLLSVSPTRTHIKDFEIKHFNPIARGLAPLLLEINEIKPALVIYNIEPPPAPRIQSWDGPFIDLTASTLPHYSGNAFPCIVTDTNNMRKHINEVDKIEGVKGFIFDCGTKTQMTYLPTIVEVCANRLDLATIPLYLSTLSNMGIKIYSMSSKKVLNPVRDV